MVDTLAIPLEKTPLVVTTNGRNISEKGGGNKIGS